MALYPSGTCGGGGPVGGAKSLIVVVLCDDDESLLLGYITDWRGSKAAVNRRETNRSKSR